MLCDQDLIKKHGSEKLVLIASRRTDIPAFYLDYLIKGLKEKKIILNAPMHKKEEFVFEKDNIHSIGVWSQDFEKWIERWNEIKNLNYNFWYRFTILPDDPYLKPKAPSAAKQLIQLEKLIEQNKRNDVVFIFIDPLIIYRKINNKEWRSNYSAEKIEPIIKKVKSLGIKDISVSIIDYYEKIENRCRKLGIEFKFFNAENSSDQIEMINIINSIKAVSDKYNLILKSCSEKFLNSARIIERGSCVNGMLLNKLFGHGASILSDKGQRGKMGCGCTLSLDIGSYSQACLHDCPQCYARR